MNALPEAGWTAELHVDRRWYELRRSPEPIPAPGRHRTRALERAEYLIGRSSPALRVDVDLRPDTGVSRRHARLVWQEGHWWVLDLDSSNGTWVSPDEIRLPTARIPGRTRLVSGSTIFLGSWSRIVLRHGPGAPPARAGVLHAALR